MARPSKKKHPLALLRIELGLLQKQLADIAGCSTGAIQSIELKRLKLSEELAARISENTGVSVRWLLAGEPKGPIPAAESTSYDFIKFSKRHYDLARSRGLSPVEEGRVRALLQLYGDLFHAIYLFARSGPPEECRVFYHRLSEGLERLNRELEGDFGTDINYKRATVNKWVEHVAGPYRPGKIEHLDDEEMAD